MTLPADIAAAFDKLVAALAAGDDEAAVLVGRESVSLAPVATGELVNSAQFGDGQISYSAPHAVPVFGEHPWILDAWSQSLPELLDNYAQLAQTALDQ